MDFQIFRPFFLRLRHEKSAEKSAETKQLFHQCVGQGGPWRSSHFSCDGGDSDGLPERDTWRTFAKRGNFVTS